MKAETKALIVFAVLILSAGPLTYFFSKEPEQIDLDGGNDIPKFITGFSIFSTNIETIQPMISYIGVSNSNNVALVRQRLDAVEEIGNYTLDMGLSSRGGGYEYVITVPLEEDSNRMVIGFKLMYWLSDFFDPQYSITALSAGTLYLPPQIKVSVSGEEVPVETSEDQIANAYLLYWQEESNPVTVNCQEVVASVTGKLTRITQPCFDATKTYLYGLPEVYFRINKIEKQKTMQILLEAFNEVQFKGMLTGNISEQTIKEALSLRFNESEITVLIQDQGFTVAVPYKNKETSYSAGEALRNINGLKIEEQYNLALAELPSSVTLDGKTYDLAIARNAYIRTPLNTELGTITVDLTFYTVFEEVVGAEGQKA